MEKNLDSVIKGLDPVEIIGSVDKVIKGITSDSRAVVKDGVFVAIKGVSVDGHRYMQQAVEAGCSVLIVQEVIESVPDDLTVIRVVDTREAYGRVSQAWFEDPSCKMKVIGVTGTNGKTSVTSILYRLFKGLGYKVGLVSTIEIMIHDRRLDTNLTTPDAYRLQAVFAEMEREGCDYVFMEVSSHAIHQRRIAGVDFDIAIFTNITHDHLDYHGTFKEYIAAKKRFFDDLKPSAVAITNLDDKNGEVMLQNTKATKRKYSLNRVADYKAKVLSSDALGMHIDIDGVAFMTRMVGRFNAYNLAAVFAVATELDVADGYQIAEVLSQLGPAKGRMELVALEPRVVVDYAHTPDALENVLSTLSEIDNRGKVITIVGCGGDRDKAKRPKMARISVTHSDQVILTSDNPRSEDPSTIIADMRAGLTQDDMSKVIEIIDREMAIKTALMLAGDRDIVLIAGKGHEEYQEVNGERKFFSDQEVVKNILFKDI